MKREKWQEKERYSIWSDLNMFLRVSFNYLFLNWNWSKFINLSMKFKRILIFSSNIDYNWIIIKISLFSFVSKNIISLNNINICFIWIFKPKWICFEYLVSCLWDVFNEIKWIWLFYLNFIELVLKIICPVVINIMSNLF